MDSVNRISKANFMITKTSRCNFLRKFLKEVLIYQHGRIYKYIQWDDTLSQWFRPESQVRL